MKLYSYIAIFLMFLVSGTVFCSMLHTSAFYLIFIAFSFFYAKISHIKLRRNDFIYFIVYSLWLLASSLYVGEFQSSSFNMVLGYLIMATGTFCILQSIDYNKFRYIFLNIAAFIALTSTILYLLQQQNLIPLTLVHGNKNDQYLMFLFNNFGWGYPFDRLAGPYWEPGAFQIVLNYAVILYFNELCHFKFNVKNGKKKMAIIVLALILTKSTAGYINLAILTVVIMANMKITKRTFIKSVFAGIFFITASFFMLSSDTYREKMAQKGEKGTSYEIRKDDNLALLTMSLEKPILGYGINSPEFISRGKTLGNTTSSNGLLALSSQLGCIFLALYIFIFYRKLKIFFPKKTLLVLFLLLLLQATEVFIFFPLAFIFFFAKPPKPENPEEIPEDSPDTQTQSPQINGNV